MGNKKRFQRRLELFDRGNTSCPICLTAFSREEVENGLRVTLEHVPPKALGGTIRCLTCAHCNSIASGSFDSAAAMRNRASVDRKEGRGVKVEVDAFGTKHTTFLSTPHAPTSNPTQWLQENANAGALRDRLRDKRVTLFAEMRRGPIWDPSKGITVSVKQPSSHHVASSYLRSAFLLVFSLLGTTGYQFARSKALQKIREKIMRPEEEVISSLLCEFQSAGTEDLIIMHNSNQPPCWIVKINTIGILLPHAGSNEHYLEVTNMPDEIEGVRLKGWRPTVFGTAVAMDLRLNENSTHVGKDLFGQEMTVTVGEYERKLIVVNQCGPVCTFMPFGPKIQKSAG